MGGPRPRLSWALTCPPLVSREKLAHGPHPSKGGVQGVGLGPVGVEAGEVHGVGGGGHGGEAATTRPAILAACSLSEVKLV